MGDYVQYGAANQYEPARAVRRRPTSQKPGVYARWLEDDVLYIITAQEKGAFLALATDAEREAFIDSFWRRRDTDIATEANEFRQEHYLRLAAANEKFAVDGKKGSLSDRGRIYIQKGPPENIIRPAGREIWTYADGERYEFVDATGKGDFRLR